MTVGISIHWTFTFGGHADLFEHADVVTAALLEQERCTPEVVDSAVSADRSARVMEIEVTVQASSEDAAGGGTANWPSHDDLVPLLPTDLRTTRVTSDA